MKKINSRVSIGVLAVFALFFFAFIGIYQDAEFGEHYVFIKHRPTLKFYFHSPLGQADKSLTPGNEGYLNKNALKSQNLYEEFVYKKKGYTRALPILLF